MEFVANESKKVEIETSTGVYKRHAIQTHFVQIGENYIDLIERYVKPLYEAVSYTHLDGAQRTGERQLADERGGRVRRVDLTLAREDAEQQRKVVDRAL